MEKYIHLTARIAGAAYILYKLWLLLFRDRLLGLWDRIFVNEKKATVAAKSKPARKRSKPKPKAKVVGKAENVLLNDPRKTAPEPVGSTDLEPTGFIGSQEPVAADDIEAPDPPYIPLDEELYEDAPPPDDNEMSSGVAFEDLSNVAEVLAGTTTDEDRRTKAARTLYNIQGTEIMDFVVREVCSADAIESLFKECLDGDGLPLRKRKSVKGFEIGMYV